MSPIHAALVRTIALLLLLLGLLRLFEPCLGADMPHLAKGIFVLRHASGGSTWSLPWGSHRFELVTVVLEHVN